jgi:hypothetical protein
MNYLEATKYPKTPHFDFSLSLQNDDRRLITVGAFEHAKRVIVTLKMDGENCNIYKDYYHPRSVIDDGHESRNWLKGFIPNFQYKIPENWRVCGENMYAEHSIRYDNLESFFYAFSIWDEINSCLPWDDFVKWCDILEIEHVPVLYDGKFDYDLIKEIYEDLDYEKQEGIVCRVAHGFLYEDFDLCVAKAVRPDHVATDEHWKKTWKPNALKKK